MAKRKRKKGYFGKSMLIISSIAFLSLTGVSYAYWNDSLEIQTTMTTGKFDVIFEKDNNGEPTIYIKNGNGNGYGHKVEVPDEYITNENIENKDTYKVYDASIKHLDNGNGKHNGSGKYIIEIPYKVEDNGTIPFEFKTFDEKESTHDDVETSNEYNENKGTLTIEIPNEPGTYPYEVELLFEQKND